jgi:hypothetical protein
MFIMVFWEAIFSLAKWTSTERSNFPSRMPRTVKGTWILFFVFTFMCKLPVLILFLFSWYRDKGFIQAARKHVTKKNKNVEMSTLRTKHRNLQ